jgi:voltage-gated potassium channel
MKQKIFNILTANGAQYRKAAKRFEILIITLVILSILGIIIDSYSFKNPAVHNTLHALEITIVIIFSIEYIARLWTANLLYPHLGPLKSRIKFMLSFEGIIDLIAIVPFYLPLIFKADFRVVRLLRVLMLIRILKLKRYSKAMHLFITIVGDRKKELAITGYITALLVLVSSIIMFQIEHSVQPEKFPNVIETLWWSVSTLTAVGYGDVYPITGLGKILSSFIALLGIGLVALPTGIISSGFIEKLRNKKHTCPNCNHTF